MKEIRASITRSIVRFEQCGSKLRSEKYGSKSWRLRKYCQQRSLARTSEQLHNLRCESFHPHTRHRSHHNGRLDEGNEGCTGSTSKSLYQTLRRSFETRGVGDARGNRPHSTSLLRMDPYARILCCSVCFSRHLKQEIMGPSSTHPSGLDLATSRKSGAERAVLSVAPSRASFHRRG